LSFDYPFVFKSVERFILLIEKSCSPLKATTLPESSHARTNFFLRYRIQTDKKTRPRKTEAEKNPSRKIPAPRQV